MPAVQLIRLTVQSLGILPVIFQILLGIGPLVIEAGTAFRILDRFPRVVQILEIVFQASAREDRHLKGVMLTFVWSKLK